MKYGVVDMPCIFSLMQEVAHFIFQNTISDQFDHVFIYSYTQNDCLLHLLKSNNE